MFIPPVYISVIIDIRSYATNWKRTDSNVRGYCLGFRASRDRVGYLISPGVERDNCLKCLKCIVNKISEKNLKCFLNKVSDFLK